LQWVDGGVTEPRGFRASGVRSGVKKEGLDLAIVECSTEAVCAGLFTTNKVKAAPVVVSMERLRRTGGRARAVVLNSGNANACTGERGRRDALATASRAASLMDMPDEEVLVASTGVIGRPLPIDKVLRGLEEAVASLSSSRESSRRAARAIMTTDRTEKEACVKLDGETRGVTIAGMAKGAGMIHPNLATMLSVVTTDARIEPEALDAAVRRAADQTFNMITVDRDTSTNDTLLVFSSGLSGPVLREGTKAFSNFERGLLAVFQSLATKMVRDAEGAGKVFEILVTGARTLEDARACARTIASSNLVKTAVFGSDPNWGRIVAAAGYSGADIDPDLISITLVRGSESLRWVYRGVLVSEEANKRAALILSEDSFKVIVDLGLGDSSATAWGCDLSYEYVRINSEYTT